MNLSQNLKQELKSITSIYPMYTKFGNSSSTHFIIKTPRGRFMKSYNTIIAFIGDDGSTVLNTVYDHSNTTNFYRCQFLNEHIDQTRKKIKSGIYSQAELN